MPWSISFRRGEAGKGDCQEIARMSILIREDASIDLEAINRMLRQHIEAQSWWGEAPEPPQVFAEFPAVLSASCARPSHGRAAAQRFAANI